MVIGSIRMIDFGALKRIRGGVDTAWIVFDGSFSMDGSVFHGGILIIFKIDQENTLRRRTK